MQNIFAPFQMYHISIYWLCRISSHRFNTGKDEASECNPLSTFPARKFPPSVTRKLKKQDDYPQQTDMQRLNRFRIKAIYMPGKRMKKSVFVDVLQSTLAKVGEFLMLQGFRVVLSGSRPHLMGIWSYLLIHSFFLMESNTCLPRNNFINFLPVSRIWDSS